MSLVVLSEEVADAKAEGRPIVALETTIVTHGMPPPENLSTAKAAERTLRDTGVTPATIAVTDGKIRVGLSEAELERLAEATDVAKLSRADLAHCLVTRGTGSTTVAATMIAARLAGISVFATGGIGGVHRGAESTFDESADLQELADSPVAVVAAGAKAILDVPKTLERLETLGVPVVAVGQDMFPAFWSRDAGLAAPLRLDDPADIAAMHVTRRSLNLRGGELIATPVPAEDEIPSDRLVPLIQSAERDAAAQGIAGKAVTPFLLSRILELTAGASLRTNVALLLNNVRLAAKISAAIVDQTDD